MADIFISYASEDRERVTALVARLRGKGWSVWWDEHITPGHSFPAVIEKELQEARCVVVLWSTASVGKKWVREEASVGEERQVLVPAMIDVVPLPFGFRTVQTANLVSWAPDSDGGEFGIFLAAIQQKVPLPEPPPPPPGAALTRAAALRRAAGPAPSESDWRLLLQRVRERRVVPVIGAGLFVERDGGGSLQARVAKRLLDEHGLSAQSQDLTPFREIHDAVAMLKGGLDRRERDWLYFKVHTAARDLLRPDAVVRAPRNKLAQMHDFDLYVTLTTDDLLANTLSAKGREVNEVVHSPRLPTFECTDLPSDWRPGAGAQLLYAFGKAGSSLRYAIDDDDVEQYLDNLNANAGAGLAPHHFMRTLRDCDLLFIGCNFPDWLTRRVARILGGGPVRIDRNLDGAGAVLLFRGLEGERLLAFESWATPTAFVGELFRRWKQGGAPVAPAAAPPKTAMFFISFAPDDLASATRIFELLESLGVSGDEIRCDRESGLRSGDAKGVEEGIQACRYFLPVVSQAAMQHKEPLFLREWDLADARSLELTRTFIVPIVVDATDPTISNPGSEADRGWLKRGLEFGFAPGGEPDDPTRKRLRTLVREARMARD